MTYSGGRTIAYNYGLARDLSDVLSQVRSITNGPATETYASYGYLGQGTIYSMTTPVASLNYDPAGDGSFGGWDNFGRIVQQTWKDPAGSLTLDGYGYSYDNAGNRSAKTNTLNSAYGESYTHDGLDRLIDAQRGGAAYQSWDLDQVGNWSGFVDQGTTQSRTTDSANQITSISGNYTPLYDAAGNMLAMPRPGEPTQYLGATWDAWNRLVGASGQSSQQQYSYEYDGLNRRLSKTVGTGQEAVATDYIYNENWQVVEEVTTQGEQTSTASYVWDQRYIDSAILRDVDSDSDGTVDQRLYYLNDANMNVTALVDGTEGSQTEGQVVERYVYDPYGQHVVMSGDWQPTTNNQSLFDNAIRFGGYRFDAETGLYQVRNRYLHMTLGWVSRDPEEYVDGMNLAAYVANRPLTATDPMGLAAATQPLGDLPVLDLATVRRVTVANSRYAWASAIFGPGNSREVFIIGGKAYPVVRQELTFVPAKPNIFQQGAGQKLSLQSELDVEAMQRRLAGVFQRLIVPVEEEGAYLWPGAQEDVEATQQVGKHDAAGGTPGEAESVIPIWGSARRLLYDLQTDNWSHALVTSLALATEAWPLLRGGMTILRGSRALSASMATKAVPVRPGLSARVGEIHGALDSIAQAQRTTAVLETSSGTRIVASGARDLSPGQRAMLAPGEVAAKFPGAHAEVTALQHAAHNGMLPSQIVSSRPFCPACIKAIEVSGGKITSPTTAVWER
jgi:RHS repeat-associated protein